MRFAFSNLSYPSEALDAVAQRAARLGYQGLEIFDSGTEGRGLISDAARTLAAFEQAGISICCIDNHLAITGDRWRHQMEGERATQTVDFAKKLGCAIVIVGAPQVARGESVTVKIGAMKKWILPLADHAAERGITLAIENSGGFARAYDLWTMLETIDHPAVRVCWDTNRAERAGESLAVSIPTLNLKIAHVRLADSYRGESTNRPGHPGEGVVPAAELIHRLSGIGYDGWVTVLAENPDASNHGDPEPRLVDALTKLKQWTARPEKVGKGHRPAATAGAKKTSAV